MPLIGWCLHGSGNWCLQQVGAYKVEGIGVSYRLDPTNIVTIGW